MNCQHVKKLSIEKVIEDECEHRSIPLYRTHRVPGLARINLCRVIVVLIFF